MATFSFQTINEINGFIENNIIEVTENDVKYSSINNFINDMEEKIYLYLKDEDETRDKNEIIQDFKEQFENFVESKPTEYYCDIIAILNKKYNEYSSKFKQTFPIKTTFSKTIDEKMIKYKPILIFCMEIKKQYNIPFVKKNADAVLKWFDEELNISSLTLKQQRCKAMLKWGKQIVNCSCGKNYQMYNKQHHILTKQHINFEANDNKIILIIEEVENNFMKQFMEKFILTNNKNDYITYEDIQKWNEENTKISMTKFGKEITDYCKQNNLENIGKTDKKINKKTKRIWFGIDYVVDKLTI